MTLWTIQPESVVSILETGDEFFCDARKSPLLRISGCSQDKNWDSYFRNSYKWMISQMELRGIKCNKRYPVWAWYKHYSESNKHNKPHMNSLRQYYRGQYRVELNVPDELVLLSDFDMWYFPINNQACCNDNNYKEIFAKSDKLKKTPDKHREFLESTWVDVFDIKNSRSIQACFPSIKPIYVKRVELI